MNCLILKLISSECISWKKIKNNELLYNISLRIYFTFYALMIRIHDLYVDFIN